MYIQLTHPKPPAYYEPTESLDSVASPFSRRIRNEKLKMYCGFEKFEKFLSFPSFFFFFVTALPIEIGKFHGKKENKSNYIA